MTDVNTNLVNALSPHIATDEARDIARILENAYYSESVAYKDIDLPEEVKDDMIVLAYELRLLLPMKSRRGSAWEDRILGFEDDDRYHMPRVVRFLVENARATGKWDAVKAMEEVLIEAAEPNVKKMLDYLKDLKNFAAKNIVEVQLMHELSSEFGQSFDLHDVLDRFVRCGLLSQCARNSLHTGVSSYEINPCLFW